MNYTIKITAGKEAFSLSENDTFVSRWMSLAETNDKTTVFQEPAFVISWYKQYFDQFKPVLCLGYNDANELIGLLPLALSSESAQLVHAGDIHAEYTGWISDKDYEQDFPAACLIEIKKRFALKQWHWNWLPPRARTDWLHSDSLAKAGIYVKYKKENSPLWDLKEEQKLKEARNDTIRNCINRYKRKGNFYIERIQDKEKAKKLLPILKDQCDFRQLIAHDIAPFEFNSNKFNFYLERMNFLKDNHCTCLWSGDKPIALHFGACDKNTVYLGLTSFDPTEYKNSPGALLIIELASLMMKEGYRYLDLTPGNDGYKDKFSNVQQELIKPVFYFARMEKFRADTFVCVNVCAKKALSLAGLRPESIKRMLVHIQSCLPALQRITFKKMIRRLLLLIHEKHTYLQYTYTFDDVSKIDSEPDVHVQNYADLLRYTGSNPWLTRTALLAEASKRFSKGEALYSIVKDATLTHYGWVSKGAKTHKLDKVDMEFKTSPQAVVLYDFYTEPKYRRQGLYIRNIKQMLYDSFHEGYKEAYIGVLHENLPSKLAIEKAGFRLYRSFSKARFLWITKKREILEKSL